MHYYNNILETIGNTPLVKLNKITKDIDATVFAKIETFNPGNSIKDRIALKMIEDAEKSGKLKPGGTIIEATSGNTGMGLAMVAVVKGYKCIFTTNDKQSKEKIDILKAMGAEVIVCPTNVSADDPRSYYSVAEKLSKEIKNSFYCNQYFNPSNTIAHYESTGPEIWEQTDGKITHLIAGVGTGGTISGVGKFLKEKNPNIKIWGIDAYGSVLKKYHETGEFDKNEIYPYITEGIGEDIIPGNVDFSIIDHFEKVSDKDGALMTRRLAREEGIFVGYSAGSAIAGLLQMKDKFSKNDLVVVIFHDHGSRYVAKVFNDDWMRERAFLENKNLTVADIISYKKNKELITLHPDEPISTAVEKITKFNISQIPIIKNNKIIGTVTETKLFTKLISRPDIKTLPVKEIMEEPLLIIDFYTDINNVSRFFNNEHNALLTVDNNGDFQIITKYDIIEHIC